MKRRYITRDTIRRANVNLMLGIRTPLPAGVRLPELTREQIAEAGRKALADFRASPKATAKDSSSVDSSEFGSEFLQ